MFANRTNTGGTHQPVFKNTTHSGIYQNQESADPQTFWSNPAEPGAAAVLPSLVVIPVDEAAGPVDLDLQSSAAVATGTLDVKAATDLLLDASNAAASGTLDVKAATDLLLDASPAVATGTADVKAATDVLLASAVCVCTGSAVIEVGEAAPVEPYKPLHPGRTER